MWQAWLRLTISAASADSGRMSPRVPSPAKTNRVPPPRPRSGAPLPFMLTRPHRDTVAKEVLVGHRKPVKVEVVQLSEHTRGAKVSGPLGGRARTFEDGADTL